ncbi:AAA family ATPase [Oligoflexus tunisiensis]|uniref:AAA family ATPase n=1 Tax=Oligoflexus tunisiensis TaxID=708132 RepID=UPI000A650762|nr:AAA family ATPase [Oligoflexus tunisiensis]
MEDNFAGALWSTAQSLIASHEAGRLTPCLHRESEIAEALQQLRVGRSVLLVGRQGIGKTAIIHGLAAQLAELKEFGIAELSTASMFTGTKYLGEWQSKVNAILHEALEDRQVLYITDIVNMATAGVTVNSSGSLLDHIRPWMQNRKLPFLAELRPEALDKLQRHPGFLELFHVIRIERMSEMAVEEILEHDLKTKGIQLDGEAKRTIHELCRRFFPQQPQPYGSLRLVDQLNSYVKRESATENVIDRALIESVFAQASGLPRLIVSRDENISVQALRQWFQERIIGQTEAIEAVIETIALYKAGLHDPRKPIGSLLFSGPTGVGKTEVARAIASYIFGDPGRLLRFDMSEYKDYHAFEMLIGSPNDATKPAKLLEPIKQQPFQVILFDELEKGHANAFDLFLQLLDEGRLTSARGERIDFHNTIVIATSNVGAEIHERQGIGFESDGSSADRRGFFKSLEGTFRPEILNRFQHIVRFHPLSPEQVRLIAQLEIRQILKREGITDRNLLVEVDPSVIDAVIARSYDRAYGARALKRALQQQLVLPLAMILLERNLTPGTILRVSWLDDRVVIKVIETSEVKQSRILLEARRQEELALPGRAELKQRLEKIESRLGQLCEKFSYKDVLGSIASLEEQREAPDFWNRPEQAALIVRDIGFLKAKAERVERLLHQLEIARQSLATANFRRDLMSLSETLNRLEEQGRRTWRELLAMGPDGEWDALVEISPIGEHGRLARDTVFELYRRWSQKRKMELSWLCEPMRNDEPCWFLLAGRLAYGHLFLEEGLHRVKRDDHTGVARVRVRPLRVGKSEVKITDIKALKGAAQMGGKVRSRLVTAQGWILQNDKTLNENRDWAAELAFSWDKATPDIDQVVRRLELAPALLVRDESIGLSSGKGDSLAPDGFHELLCRRLDCHRGSW